MIAWLHWFGAFGEADRGEHVIEQSCSPETDWKAERDVEGPGP